MILKIKSWRRTKKGNYGFQTDHGEFFLNLNSAKCRENFVQYFPHMTGRVRLIIEKDFDPDKFVGEYCHAYPILEPLKKTGAWTEPIETG